MLSKMCPIQNQIPNYRDPHLSDTTFAVYVVIEIHWH